MSTVEDGQWDAWSAALNGQKLDLGPRGNPSSGYYRRLTKDGWEAIGIWRKDGWIRCRNSNTKFDVSKFDCLETDAEKKALIDDLLACRVYAIPFAIYKAVAVDRQSFPPEYKTKLTTNEEQAGVVWTLELARAKLGEVPGIDLKIPKQVELTEDEIKAARFKKGVAAEFPGATVVKDLPSDVIPFESRTGDIPGEPAIGHNNPPEEVTPWGAIAAQVKQFGDACAAWLKGLPTGKIETQADADQLANYANKFKTLENTAEDARKTEKAPVLEQAAAIDAKWGAPRDTAITMRQRCLDLTAVWMKAETAKRQAEVDTANKAAREAAVEAAVISGGPIEDVPQVAAAKVTAGTSGRALSARKTKTWRALDREKFAIYLLRMKGSDGTPRPHGELVELLDKIAGRLGRNQAEVPAGLIVFDEGEKVQ